MKLAVTGHRPDKLFGCGKPECYTNANYRILVDFCVAAINHFKKEDSDLVMITGMALGFDMAIAEACIECDVPFMAYVPFKEQARLWPHLGQVKYQYLLTKAQKIVMTSDKTQYSPELMFIRNHKMVDDSDGLLALWNGDEFGGTYECLTYAKRLWKIGTLFHSDTDPVITNIWKNWFNWKKEKGIK